MLVGCGGDANYDSTDGQFANEPAGNYDAEITQATFKPKQTVAQTNNLLLSVENTGDKTIPALALTVRLVGEGAVQLHGGMGVTEELALGGQFKRGLAIAAMLGSKSQHLARHAQPA